MKQPELRKVRPLVSRWSVANLKFKPKAEHLWPSDFPQMEVHTVLMLLLLLIVALKRPSHSGSLNSSWALFSLKQLWRFTCPCALALGYKLFYSHPLYAIWRNYSMKNSLCSHIRILNSSPFFFFFFGTIICNCITIISFLTASQSSRVIFHEVMRSYHFSYDISNICLWKV